MNSIGFVVSLYVHQENSTDRPLAEIYASVLRWKFVVEFGGLDAGGALGESGEGGEDLVGGLVPFEGPGFSFHALTHSRTSLSNVWSLRWSLRWSIRRVISANRRSACPASARPTGRPTSTRGTGPATCPPSAGSCRPVQPPPCSTVPPHTPARSGSAGPKPATTCGAWPCAPTGRAPRRSTSTRPWAAPSSPYASHTRISKRIKDAGYQAFFSPILIDFTGRIATGT